ncbi:MAG: hypothetical protein M1839_003198 [Geoglossum umbratile]|nr:MAG: hypothetical protein M1839_003198 [Geoglossum umbratile]
MNERAAEAAEVVMLCFIAQDWSRSAKVLEVISYVLLDFLKEKGMAQTASGWKTITRIAAIYEHSDKPDKALEWYLYALRRLENLRQGVSDLGARRGIQASIDSAELYSGLARTCLYFAERQYPLGAGTPKQWDLPASGWSDQALLFLEQGRARALLDTMLAKESVRTEELREWTHKSHRAQLFACLLQSRASDTT